MATLTLYRRSAGADGRIVTILKRVIKIVLIKEETFESKGLKDVREGTTWLSGEQCSKQSKESGSWTVMEMGGCLVCSQNRKEGSVTEWSEPGREWQVNSERSLGNKSL